MNGTGLLPYIKDERDLKLGGFFDQPFLADLPSEYVIEGWKIKDQKSSDFCSAFAFCGLSELQEGVELSPEFSFALSKLLSGDVDGWGQDLKSAASTLVKWGSLKKSDAPFSLETKDPQFLRRIENWGDTSKLLNNAITHSKEGYYKTSGRYLGFDNIRSWLWKFKDERRAVASGILWGWDTDNAVIETIPAQGDGHAVAYIGWSKHQVHPDGKINPQKPFPDGKTRMILANSWGTSVGDNGFFYIDPEVINHFVDIYGGLMFKDITPERARFLQKNGLKQDGAKIKELLKPLWNKVYLLLAELIAELYTTKYPTENPTEIIVEPDIPVKTASQYLLEAAIACEGRDMAKTQDVFGCAESLNAVHKLAFGAEIGGTTSTYRLFQALRMDKTFQKVTNPLPGDIIICVTSQGNGTIPNGHTGIVGEESAIWSSNAKTFKWDKHFTLFSWKLYYEKKGGYPTHLFRKVV